MERKLKTILLLDDNSATNYIHKKFLIEANCAERILDFQSGINALKYLNSEVDAHPDLIFIDINMPIMDAWEFLEGYRKIEHEDKQKTKKILLSTSLSPSDKERASKINFIDGIRLKPLNIESIHSIINDFFPELVLHS